MANNKRRKLDGQDLALKILGYVFLGIAALCTALVIFGRLIPAIAGSTIYKDVDIFTAAKGFNPWLRSLSYAVCFLTLAYAFRKLLSLSFSFLKHGKAIVSLICSFIKYVAVIVVVFMILATFGVDTTALIAGLGILSLVLGLAIQPLLQDIIAGIFVVFEKVYDVGDVVVVDNFRGTVIEIGIRTTKLQDAGGDVKVINNSDIRTLINMTNELSYAICDVDIEYGESLERVEGVIQDNLGVIKEKIPTILDGPYYKGVAMLGSHGVTLRLVAQCKEDAKFQTQRDMNRQIKLIFDQNGIGIPFPQVVVHNAKPSKKKSANSGATDAFVLEQNSLSKDIGDEENGR